MRHPFQAQPDLQLTPIEKIRLPLKSRDELPPILAGLQWLWMHPTLKAEILALLKAAVLAEKKATGRTGMTLWQILVLGVVRLGLDADWDRMEDLANHHLLVRQMLQVPATPWGAEDKMFGHQTLRDNVALLDDELLQAINARLAAAGREVFAKKDGAPLAALEIKVDSYVLETDVHFPTDLSLLWDAGRKCVDLVEGFRASGYAMPGWRKFKAWRRQLKNLQRTTSQIVYRGGPNKEARVKSAVREYLAVGGALCAKVQTSLLELCGQPVCATRWEKLAYFHTMLDKHLDLVQRRLLKEETIPAHEKVFSLFEPHTEWIQKGKQPFHQVHTLAPRVPKQVQIRGEMHVGFQHIAVHLHFKRREGRAGFFCEHLPSRRRDARVDLLQQFVIQQRDVVPQGLMAEDFGILTPRRGGHAQHLPHEQMIIGHVLHPIPVRIQSQPHDAEDKDLPEVHAGATGGLFAHEDFGFQQGEDLRLERGVHPDPLQTGQDGRQLIPALEWQPNLFDGGDLQIRLGWEGLAHRGE